MFRRLAVGLIACAGVCGPALAQEAPIFDGTTELFTHNGSVMKLAWITFDKELGGSFTITYEKPRSGLNVLRGTLLVSAHYNMDDGAVEGSAFTFKRGCGPAKYHVVGEWGENGDLYLDGFAPVRAPGFCEVIGFDETNNSHLVFEPK